MSDFIESVDGLSDSDKRKIREMSCSDEKELVSQIRASEDASRSFLGGSVVDLLLKTFASSDRGKLDKNPGYMGVPLTKG